MGLRDRFRRLIAPSWQTPPSYASSGGGIRVSPGDRCPCGRGAVYKTYSPIHGHFLGCTAYDSGRGCHHAWKLNGDRLPPESRRPH
jgi:hypothetical protein